MIIGHRYCSLRRHYIYLCLYYTISHMITGYGYCGYSRTLFIYLCLQERKFLIERCQEIASAQCIRFSFLSGDVHVCAAGRLYSDPKVTTIVMVTLTTVVFTIVMVLTNLEIRLRLTSADMLERWQNK